MEKILEEKSLIKENEKIIANILHDIKSPLYGIKIALQNNLSSELNNDIFETILGLIKYIEDFLLNYSFETGKLENKLVPCNIKDIVNKKINDYKYIFINKNIHIDIISDDEKYCTNTIEVFVESIIGNIISNIAFHASSNQHAEILFLNKTDSVIVEFKNLYNSKTDNFNLGLEFCKRLAQYTKIEIVFCKSKNKVCVKLKIPKLKN